MPATRPTNADPKPKHNEDTNVIDHSGIPFSMHYDKLVIAVGAYSQSDYSTSFSFSITDKFLLQLLTCLESKNMPIF
jgi:NADPH-dependent 2,4-dienoyl-CoA reductase/sulfur reductase-like enzyme